MMGTYWELFKTRKIPSPPPLSNPKRKKTCIRLNVEPFHQGHKKFISQNCWSPTWTNSTIVSILVWGTYYVVHYGILCFALIRWGASQVDNHSKENTTQFQLQITNECTNIQESFYMLQPLSPYGDIPPKMIFFANKQTNDPWVDIFILIY